MSPIERILDALGVPDHSGEHRFKAGPGVVGRNSRVGMAGVGGIVAIAYLLPDRPMILLAIAGLVVAVVVTSMVGNWIYANKHPDHALMEGAQLLEFARIKAGAREPGIIIDQPPAIGGATSSEGDDR